MNRYFRERPIRFNYKTTEKKKVKCVKKNNFRPKKLVSTSLGVDSNLSLLIKNEIIYK